MIDFKPLTLEDKNRVEPYIYSNRYRSCSLAFAHLYCWPGYIETRWAVVDGFLVFRMVSRDTCELFYFQPIGKGDFSHILPLLKEDAYENNGHSLRVCLLGEEEEVAFGAGTGEWAVYEDRSLSEYIYSAEQLRTLAGRKYQAKRNHLGHFMTQYPYRYEILAPKHFEACLELDERWRKSHALMNECVWMGYEREALERAFSHWEELDLLGGVLYVGDVLVGFTYGSMINHDTFAVMMEKGDMSYHGVYVAINKLFVEHLPSECLYINREEDLGIMGLRSSKLSYHPMKLLPIKQMLYLNRKEQDCKLLWREVFGDENLWIDHFFVNHYTPEQLYTIEVDQKVCSMLYVVPFRMNGRRVGYVYAVATAVQERGKGYATRLLQQAIVAGRENGFEALALIPADEDLYRYYARLGFRGRYSVSFVVADGYDFGSGDHTQDRLALLPLHATFEMPEEEETITLIR